MNTIVDVVNRMEEWLNYAAIAFGMMIVSLFFYCLGYHHGVRKCEQQFMDNFISNDNNS